MKEFSLSIVTFHFVFMNLFLFFFVKGNKMIIKQTVAEQTPQSANTGDSFSKFYITKNVENSAEVCIILNEVCTKKKNKTTELVAEQQYKTTNKKTGELIIFKISAK